jgi:hypothetical protein
LKVGLKITREIKEMKIRLFEAMERLIAGWIKAFTEMRFKQAMIDWMVELTTDS